MYEYFVSNPGLTEKPSHELNLPLFPKPTLTLKQNCTICQKLHFWSKIRHISTKIIPQKAAARFSNGIGHLVVGFKAKAIFGVLTRFLITVNDHLPKTFLKNINTTDGSLESSTAELVTEMVETSSITIRNSAVYQQLLCIGQQCHNRLSSIKSAAVTVQSFNMICNSQCQKIMIIKDMHIRIPKKTSAENLGCWHSGTPS